MDFKINRLMKMNANWKWEVKNYLILKNLLCPCNSVFDYVDDQY